MEYFDSKKYIEDNAKKGIFDLVSSAYEKGICDSNKSNTCTYKEIKGISNYHIECLNENVFSRGYLNTYKYCPYCGKKIKFTREVHFR